ncbi:MAG: TonB family protein, partial [Sphingomicrobium sp.]
LAIASFSQTNSALPADVWEWDSKAPICALKQRPSADGQIVKIERTPGNDETVLQITLPVGSKLQEGHFPNANVETKSGRRFGADISIRVWNGRRELYVVSPDPALIDNLSNTTSLSFSHPKLGNVGVPIRILSTLVDTLRECEDKIMSEWGIDPTAWRSLKSRPLPLANIRNRFNDLDYPREALAANVEADAIIRLDVAADGTAGACRSLNRGLMPGFQTAACKVLKGARFQPATDSGGTSVTAPIVYDVRFRIGN